MLIGVFNLDLASERASSPSMTCPTRCIPLARVLQVFHAYAMPGTITRLVVQKRNRRRINVYLDDTYAFSLSDILAARLTIGQVLSDEAIAQLQAQDAYQQGMDKALRLIARRPRSRHEVDEALRQAGFEAPTRERILSRLTEMAYLDDEAFAHWWVENRIQFNPRSIKALRQELWQKGISNPLIDRVLEPLDDLTLALAAGRQRAYRWRGLPRQDFENRLLGYLQRRGFDYPTAREVTDILWEEARSS